MLRPPYLKKNDTIGIFACARKVTLIEIQPAIDIFKSWDLQVVLSKNLFDADHQFSGTDELRTVDLQTMLNDATIKAIISARGGYGTLRIIDQLEFQHFNKHPKWVIGYSDVTVLLAHIYNIGVETIHATMPINFNKSLESLNSLHAALFGEPLVYKFEGHVLNKFGVAKGELIGGNLSILYALIGSNSDVDTTGKILFIEDLDEYLYHIDRMMVSLKRAGKLSQLAGLIVGGMTKMRDNQIPFGKTAPEIILDAVKEYNYPVCFNFPAGHTAKNVALYFGRRAMLTIENSPNLVFE